MKLNNDCVRDLLLYIEENASLSENIYVETISDMNYPTETLIYTSIKLKEANYINAQVEQSYDEENGGYSVTIISLTWQGHKFLDNIRDNKVWKTTKGIVSKFSSVSLSVIENVAAQVITNIITQQMGQPPQ